MCVCVCVCVCARARVRVRVNVVGRVADHNKSLYLVQLHEAQQILYPRSHLIEYRMHLNSLPLTIRVTR